MAEASAPCSSKYKYTPTKFNIIFFYNLKGEDLLNFLREYGLIPNEGEYKCPQCKGNLALYKEADRIDGYRWRCTNYITSNKTKRRLCGKKVEFRSGTFFHNSHLQIFQILGFAAMWVRAVKLSVICDELTMGMQAAVDWASFCREVVLESYLSNPQKLGGVDKIVEIDESKFGKRKYHRGHRVEGQWVFGGYERGTGLVFMIPVENRSAETLLLIIKEWILPGTTIISDCWKAYDCLEKEGYRHLQVNHSLHFKDPVTEAHTNAIESSWRAAKASMSASGRRKRHMAGNLARYMFQKRCRLDGVDMVSEFLRLAGQVYNPLKPQAGNDRDEEGELTDEAYEDSEEEI